MSYTHWRNSYTHFLFHLSIKLMLYSGLSGRVRTVCLFSLCVVLLLSSKFTASALVWFYNFLKYLLKGKGMSKASPVTGHGGP
jgi:hypothetical protein